MAIDRIRIQVFLTETDLKFATSKAKLADVDRSTYISNLVRKEAGRKPLPRVSTLPRGKDAR